MNNLEMIKQFYDSFASDNAEAMTALYHDEVTFHDPAFGELHGERVRNMWRMLIERGKGNIKITCSNIFTDSSSGKADWSAEYKFSTSGRKVINHVSAEFEFKEGKIYNHRDNFSFWRWSGQALGTVGWLLGYLPFFRNKIRRKLNSLLDKYIETRNKN